MCIIRSHKNGGYEGGVPGSRAPPARPLVLSPWPRARPHRRHRHMIHKHTPTHRGTDARRTSSHTAPASLHVVCVRARRGRCVPEGPQCPRARSHGRCRLSAHGPGTLPLGGSCAAPVSRPPVCVCSASPFALYFNKKFPSSIYFSHPYRGFTTTEPGKV